MIILQQNWHSSITEFGTQLGFNIWDWSAVLISICSVIIAIGSLIVAFMTLKSQKKTEKNTTPSITIDSQVQLLCVLVYNILQNISKLNAIRLFLTKNKFEGYLLHYIFEDLKLDPDKIHTDLVNNRPNDLIHISDLKKEILFFNSQVDDFALSLKMKNLGNKHKLETLIKLELKLSSIFNYTTNTICNIFNQEHAFIQSILSYPKYCGFVGREPDSIKDNSINTSKKGGYIEEGLGIVSTYHLSISELSDAISSGYIDVENDLLNLLLKHLSLPFKNSICNDFTMESYKLFMAFISYKYYKNTFKQFSLISFDA